MPPKNKFADGERVLCFHGPLLYEAKCVKAEVKEKSVRYFIHYNGWNKSWDEWVPESRVLKYNEAALQKQKELKKAHDNKTRHARGPKPKPDEKKEKKDGSKERDRDRDKDSESRDRERHRDRERERDRDREKDREKERPSTPSATDTSSATKKRGPPSKTDKEKAKDKEREKEKEKAKEKDRDKERDKERDRERDRERDKEHEQRDKERPREAERENASTPSAAETSAKRKGAPAAREKEAARETPVAVATPEALQDQPKKKRARVDPTVESEEHFQTKIEVKVRIPEELKPWLVDDWDLITRQKQLVSLPCKITVDALLEDFVKFKTAKGNNPHKDAIVEVLQGVREYFNVMLGTQLLYKFERPQYAEILADHPDTPMTQLYGPTHLLRLFVKLGGMLAYTPLEEKSIQLLLTHIHDLIKYMTRNTTNLFNVNDYIVAPPEYHRKAL